MNDDLLFDFVTTHSALYIALERLLQQLYRRMIAIHNSKAGMPENKQAYVLLLGSGTLMLNTDTKDAAELEGHHLWQQAVAAHRHAEYWCRRRPT